MAASTTLVSSSGAVPQIDAHHTIQIADHIVIQFRSTQAPQNQLKNHAPPEPNLPISDLRPSENWKLHKAALKGNLEETKLLLGDNPQWMLRTGIANRCQTVLHIATGAGKVSFVEEIIKMMEPDDLKLQDENGNTTFCIAAANGSIEIAKLMLEKNPDLLTLRGADNMVPLYLAALFGRVEMANFSFDGMESHLTPQDKADIFLRHL
ncbi:hypothetical protein Q3G72_008100 [Acer saccharum]|nr:hypothetical protein Q3G72_008100 [Acer saccharum]